MPDGRLPSASEDGVAPPDASSAGGGNAPSSALHDESSDALSALVVQREGRGVVRMGSGDPASSGRLES